MADGGATTKHRLARLKRDARRVVEARFHGYSTVSRSVRCAVPSSCLTSNASQSQVLRNRCQNTLPQGQLSPSIQLTTLRCSRTIAASGADEGLQYI